MIGCLIRILAARPKPRSRKVLKTNERKMREIITRELKPVTPLKRKLRR